MVRIYHIDPYFLMNLTEYIIYLFIFYFFLFFLFYFPGLHLEIGRFCRYNMPGINNSEPVEFFRILRVYFIKLDSPICDGDAAAETTPPAEGLDHPDAATAPLAAAAAAGDQTVCYPFIYETFTPELVREKDGDGCGQALQQPVLVERLEKMKETFAKVIAFLRNSGELLRLRDWSAHPPNNNNIIIIVTVIIISEIIVVTIIFIIIVANNCFHRHIIAIFASSS